MRRGRSGGAHASEALVCDAIDNASHSFAVTKDHKMSDKTIDSWPIIAGLILGAEGKQLARS